MKIWKVLWIEYSFLKDLNKTTNKKLDIIDNPKLNLHFLGVWQVFQSLFQIIMCQVIPLGTGSRLA